MRGVRQLGERVLGAAAICVLVTVALCSGLAHADRFSGLEKASHDSSWRVRLQAAQVLSKVKDPRSIDLLERLLQDSQESVRRAAQIGLSRLRQDTAPVVRPQKDAVVQIGGVWAKARSVRPTMTNELRKLLEREFQHTPIVVINGQAVNGYLVDGSIVALDRKSTREMIEVTVEVSVIVGRLPSRAMVMMTSGGATVQEPKSGTPPNVASLESDALEGAVKGAHENLLAYLKTH